MIEEKSGVEKRTTEFRSFATGQKKRRNREGQEAEDTWTTTRHSFGRRSDKSVLDEGNNMQQEVE